jgi:hypothetical protein
MATRYDVRVGDAERDSAVAQLREHFVAGRLTLDELKGRLGAALSAKTHGQLSGLMRDLPPPPRPRPAATPEVATPLRAELARFAAIAAILMVLATWLLFAAWLANRSYWYAPHYYHYGHPPFQGP